MDAKRIVVTGATSGIGLETEDGFELTIGVNHLGPFLLTNMLLPLLRRAPELTGLS